MKTNFTFSFLLISIICTNGCKCVPHTNYTQFYIEKADSYFYEDLKMNNINFLVYNYNGSKQQKDSLEQFSVTYLKDSLNDITLHFYKFSCDIEYDKQIGDSIILNTYPRDHVMMYTSEPSVGAYVFAYYNNFGKMTYKPVAGNQHLQKTNE